jgi:thiol-disulfide isomerase/thioredoxin
MSEFLKRPFVLAAIAIVVIAVAAVLYVNGRSVHASDRPPVSLSVLAAQKPTATPAVAFTDVAGKPHMLSEFRGRYVLLNLWATWCGPCVKELPALAKLHAAVPDGFTVVAVNVGRSTEAETKAFLAGHNASVLAAYTDHNLAMMRAFHVYGLPVSVLIDPKGDVVARADGPAPWDAPDVIAYFKALSRAKS